MRHPLQNKQETDRFPAYFVACGRGMERERGLQGSANPGLSPLSNFPSQVFLHDLLIFYFATDPFAVSVSYGITASVGETGTWRSSLQRAQTASQLPHSVSAFSTASMAVPPRLS